VPGPEGERGWLCPKCLLTFRDGGQGPDVEHFRSVCIHCIRSLRETFDRRFDPDDTGL
jgi:hypothetical protein